MIVRIITIDKHEFEITFDEPSFNKVLRAISRKKLIVKGGLAIQTSSIVFMEEIG